MRKAQKKLTEDYLKLLNQAHDGIQKALKLGNISAAKDLLEQCQSGRADRANRRGEPLCGPLPGRIL